MNNYHTIFSIHESGAASSWDWSAVMCPNRNGGYDVRFEQILWDCNEEDEPSLFEMSNVRDGVVLFNFLKDCWCSEHENDFDQKQWEEIIMNISEINVTLSNQVREAMEREGDKEDIQISDSQILRVIGVERVAVWSQIYSVVYMVETSTGPAFLYPPADDGIGWVRFGSLGMGAGTAVKVRLTKEISNQLQELKPELESLNRNHKFK